MTTTLQTHPSALRKVRQMARRISRTVLSPPPRWSLSQWADERRELGPEESAEPGRWRTARVPFLREIMDACTDPGVREVVLMKSAQVAFTQGVLNNLVAYHIDQDPAPILVVQPTVEEAEKWSKEKLAPMLRNTPCLAGKVADAKSRDSGNTISAKSFTGGHLGIVGANAPSGLRARVRRILCFDEIDGYPASAGTEGDPITLARRRATTYWNRKVVLGSTPTLKGLSRIEQAFLEGDQRRFHVPCPECGHEQTLKWGALVYKDDHGERLAKPVHGCESCGALIPESKKLAMLDRGRWIAAHPGRPIRSYHINALYSPWMSWDEIVDEWLASQGNPERLKAFVNTILGETWEEQGERVSAHMLYERLEPFPVRDGAPLVPNGAAVLTRSVDVQGYGLETAVWAWGPGEEAWRIDWEVIDGDPGQEAVWKELDERVMRTYRHESGAELRPLVTFVDSGGHHTAQAYQYARLRFHHKVYAIKGSNEQEGVPLIKGPNKQKGAGVLLYMVGSFTGKELLAARLKVKRPGPGYIHLPETIAVEHLEQLTAETLVTRYVKGRPVRAWVKEGGTRNEQTDLYVYALAALHSRGAALIKRLPAMAERLRGAQATPDDAGPAADPQADAPEEHDPQTNMATPRRPRRRGAGGWATDGWR